MQEHCFVFTEVSKRGLHDSSRTRQTRLSMSNDPVALPTIGIEPLIEETEIRAAVVYLDVVQASELPPTPRHQVLGPPITNPRQILRQVNSCIGVMTDA
jgi:hypothetical protein